MRDGRTEFDGDIDVESTAIVGHVYEESCGPATFAGDGTVRGGTIIYGDVAIGDGFNTGHDVLIREQTTLGDDVLVGTKTVIDGYTDVGSHVSMQTGVYVPSHTTIGDQVFLGPHAVLTNDPYPIRRDVDLKGPTIEDSASIAANATLLPDVTIGQNSFVAAGTVVTDDVPPDTLAVGAPAEHRELPAELEGGNRLE
jgi:acetyltransferase-like isoleucine patch superfamily enzyme